MPATGTGRERLRDPKTGRFLPSPQVLTYPLMSGTATKFASLTRKQAREEYSRLRSIAQKRIARMENTELKGSPILAKYQDKFKKLKDITDEKQFYDLFYDLSKFLQGEEGTLAKMRQQKDKDDKALEALRAHGFNIDEHNHQEFKDFWDFVRSKISDKLYPNSDFVVELFENISASGLHASELLDPTLYSSTAKKDDEKNPTLNDLFKYWIDKRETDRKRALKVIAEKGERTLFITGTDPETGKPTKKKKMRFQRS